LIYADTSFFVSVYITDSNSPIADHTIRSGMRPCFTPLHLAEWEHAIAQQIFRGQLSLASSQSIYQDLQHDLAAGLWEQVAFPEDALARCANLGRHHGPNLGVRTLDTLHVACALELKAERFWTFDERQAKLARAEGLKTS
jgi:predicted nucleic acid-binding protein